MNVITRILNRLLSDDQADGDARELASFTRGLLLAIPDIVFEVDRNGTYLNVWTKNPEWLASPEEDLLGKTVVEVLPPAQAEQALKAISMADQQGVHNGGIFPVTTETGEERWFEHLLAKKPGLLPGSACTFLVLSHDVTSLKHTELAFREKFTELQTILQTIPDMVWLKDPGGRYIFCNSAFEQFTGQQESDIAGKKGGDVFHIDDARKCQESDHAAMTKRGLHISEDKLKNPKTGETVYLEVHKCPIFDNTGDITGVLSIGRDITHKRQLQQQLARHEQEYRSLVENSPDLIARIDRQLRHVYVNPALAERLGGADVLLGKTPSQVDLPGDASRYEQYLTQALATGASQEFELHWSRNEQNVDHLLIRLTPEPGPNGEVETVLMVGRDITELYQSRETIWHMAFFDALTGLPNRALFEKRCSQAIADTVKHGQTVAVMLLDLDRLKLVNDSLGHETGDVLLRQVAERLSAAVRAGDTVARFGGDEYAILLPKVPKVSDVRKITDQVLSIFSTPFILEERELYTSCSMGLALCHGDNKTPSDLIKHADSAMYKAKAEAGNSYCFYSTKLTKKARQHLILQQDLRKAIESNQFELHFQPKVLLQDGSLVSAEALLRWHHPDLGLVPPTDFIAAAEETGLIVPIGQWVLDIAAQTAVEWNRNRDQPLRIAVNLSTVQFRFSDLLGTVQQTLEQTGCKPQWLEFEVTESLLLSNDNTTQNLLQELAKRGITTAIDDFGTGYSALSYLHQFDIDCLKIDRQFVCEVEQSPRSRELLRAIIAIADAFSLDLVAEGIETAGQADLLAELGCPMGQGFLFGRPVPKHEFEQLWLGDELMPMAALN